MAYFVLICTDKPGALETRMATRERHLAYLAELGVVKAGGAFLDADGKPEGSMLVVEVDDLAAAQTVAANDPYALAGVFAKVEVRPWRMAVGAFA